MAGGRGRAERAAVRLAAAIGLLGALACGGLPLGAPALPLTRELTGDELAAAVALGDRVVDGRLPDDVTGEDEAGVAAACAERGAAFAWLAARDPRPEVRLAATRALPPCADAVPHADLSAVARTRLRDDGRPERAAAFAVAAAALHGGELDPELAAVLVVGLRHDDPAVRYEALEAVDEVSWGADPEVTAAVAGVLSAPEPWLVTEALRRVRFRAGGVADPAPLVAAVRPLLSDIDPGLRGRAALALVRLSPSDPELSELLVGLLSDAHPYTKSAAAEALGDLGFRPAVHDLVRGMDDRRANTWDHLPFERLDGTMVVQHHVGSPFERVDEAWLRALVHLTEGDGDAAFVLREIHPGKYRDLDVLSATRDAQRWYGEHGEAVPPR